MDLSSAVNKLSKFSSNTGKVNFEVLVHLLRYIRDNKTLGLKYYAGMNDTPVYDLFRKARINNDNQLMAFSDYNWQDCLDTGRITVTCIIFYQCGTIDHGKHVTRPVSQ